MQKYKTCTMIKKNPIMAHPEFLKNEEHRVLPALLLPEAAKEQATHDVPHFSKIRDEPLKRSTLE